MVKKNRMQKLTAHAKVSQVHKAEKAPIGVAAGVALVSTLAIATPALATQQTKESDASLHDAIVAPANQGAQSPAAGVAGNTAAKAAAKAAAGTTDAASHSKAAKHSAKSTQAAQGTPAANGSNSDAAGTDRTAEPATQNGSAPLHANNDEPAAQPTGAHNAESSSTAAATHASIQPAENPASAGTLTSGETPQGQAPTTPTRPKENDTSNQQVVKPNTKHQEAQNLPTANSQVTPPENQRKTIYNFTVHYSVAGNQTKQLLQPTEFSFTEDKLNQITDNADDGVYIPVPTTKGYRAPRGNYVKDEHGKFVLDTEHNGLVQTYIKVDKALIEKNINKRLSKNGTVVSEYTLEYNPKQVTFYIRHMLQNPDYDPHITDPNDKRSKQFIEYTDLTNKVKLKDAEGHEHVVCVSKAVGLVGSQVFAQPINIEGYSPEPNLVGSSIPDDANYTEADEDEASSTTPDASQTTPHKESKHLVFELRYLLKKHEVTYDVQGGTAIQGHVYKFGATMLEVNNPTRDGYKFTGWTVKGIKGKEHEAPSLDPNFTKQVLPDNDVKFVAHWEPEHTETTYWVNVWVQKARLVKPDDPNSLDNYDYVGRVKRTGKSDENIENKFTKYNKSFDAPTDMLNGKYRVIKGTLTADERKQVHFDGLDTTNDRIKADVEKVLASDKEFDRFYKPNYQLENRLNAGEAPEWFGAKEMRPLYKLRPDGTTVLNAVYDRQVYTYYFAKPDGSKKSTDANPYANPPIAGDPDYKGNARDSSTTVTIGGKKYTYDKDKHDSAYAIKVRFNEELRPGIEFPKTSQITYSPVDRTHDIDGTEIDGSKEEPQANMGLYILGDATNTHKGKSDGDNVFDTPPYRFGFEDVYYTREVQGADFYNKQDFFCFSKHYHQGTSTTEVGSYDYNPYQRLFTPFPMDTRQFSTGKPSNGPFHVVIRVETPESAAARLKDPSAKPQYKLSVMSYTQYNYIYRDGDISKSSLLGWNGFVGPNLIGYKTPSSTSGGDPAIWNNEDEYFFGNNAQKPILDPNASIPKTHMQCVYELLYQDYCAYLKSKGESKPADLVDGMVATSEKERFKAYVYEKWKDAFDFTYKKNSKGEYVQEGLDKEGNPKEVPVKYPFSAILVWTYDRTTPTIRFHNDASSDVEDAQGHAATIQSPFDTDLFKKDFIVGGHISDDGTTLTPTITPYTPEGQAPEQFPGTYRFQLNGKDYFIKRPDNLPKDYVFDGWALDANGSQVLIPHMKSDGTAMTAQDIIDYIKKQTTKRVVPDAGLSLYAHWVPSQITHKITVDMNRGDGSTSDVFVKHGACAHKAKNDGTVRDKKDIPKDEFPLAAERPGYVFYGWQVKTLDKQGNAHWLPFAFSTPVVDNLEVRAEWIEDKRVTGTVRQVFLNPGCTIKQYEAAKEEADRTGDRTKLESLIHNVRVETLHDLRPGSSTSVQAGYRDDEYFPDHTYSTFVVDTNESKNSAEFVYEPYAKRSYTVHYVDAAGKEIAPAEPQEGNASIYTTHKLNYNVVEAKTIPGYVLKKGVPTQHQFVIKPNTDGSYNDTYDYTFVYDDVRILSRKDDTQVTPTNYSRLVFKTESTELVVDSNKQVVSRTSAQPGGELKPFAFAPTEHAQNVSEIVLDAVNGTKAYQLPLPTPVAKEGYTFVGWTSEDYYADGQKYEGASRLPANSQTFDHKIVYIAHFKKTENAFVGSDPNAAAPKGYYKVNYTADQNGRLSRVITDGHGNTRTETLDTLTNVVVLDKYKVNVIKAPTPVADKGFVATEGFSFDGKDAKDRTYVKHFEMIDPVAVAHRYVLPGNSVLAADETAKSLIQNADQYKNEEDGNPGKLATYRFLDEKGNVVASLDNTTPGEHKVFIEVEAGRDGHRVKKKVPFFYTIMPRAFLQGELDKYDPASVAANYKKYTFKSKREQGVMTGRETAQKEGDFDTLAAYVYAGTSATPAGTYKLDVPAAAGRDFEANGYHYVFRGWKKVTTPDSTPAAAPAHFMWKEFTPDIGPKDHYKDITPTENAAYVAMYEKIPYIVQKSEDGTVPPDSVVVSFKPAAGRAWKDGSTGPKVLYIKKGMDISKLDEHGVPIKPGETKKSILQVLGEQLYGYTGDWTKSSMDGITLIDSMTTGAGADGWKSNNAFQEFVARQTPYTDPVGGVEKTIIQGTAAPNAIDFVKNISDFTGGTDKPFTNISAEFVDAPATDAAANLTVPIKVTVTYKDSADATHTRVYNITGSLHVLGDVLSSKDAPKDETLKDKYTSISFVTNKVPVLDEQGHETQTKEDQGQLSGADEQGTLTYLAFKKDNANYTINIPKVSGLDYTANGYHYVFTGWKQKVAAPASGVVPQTINAADRQLTFTAQQSIVFEAQYKKVPYITTKTDDGKVPDDSVVAAFKPAPGRTWKDGTTGPKVFYVKKGQDVHKLAFDIVENGQKKHYSSIIDYFKDQLFDNTGWTKSSMEGIASISDVKDSDWTANNAFQEYVAKQTDYVAPTLGSAQTIIQGTQIPDAKTFISNISELKKDNVEKVEVSYSKEPSSKEAANYTVPLKVTVTYKDSASESHQKVYNLVGYLNVLGDVLSSKDAPKDETLKNQYTTITFVSKKQKVVDAQGHETSQTEEPGQVSGASESADHTQSELQYLTFKKTGANYTINIPKVSGLDYTANGYHYVFTGWKQKVEEGTSTSPQTINAADRQLTFTAQQSIVFEAQYKKVPYIVTKVTDGTIPEDSVVVSFKPAPGRKWADGSTGPKVLYIKKGMDISRLDEHGRPIKDNDTTTKSILQVLGSQLAGYESDWSKSSMDGITLIKSMKDGAGADGWKSNNAFQEFVAHQKAHTEPKTIEQYQAIIQNTQVPTANDFIKNDQDLKDLLMKNGVAIAGKENIESYKVEFVGEAPKSKIAGTYLVPLKVTIKYRDMDSENVFMLNSQLKVIYGVLYGKNKPAQDKQPIDYKVFDGHYRKVTFITDKNEKLQPKGTIIGDEDKNSVDYYVAKDQELRVRVPKMLNQDYEKDGYHYKFVGWKLVPSKETVVQDDKNELGAGDIKFGTPDADTLVVSKTKGDLIYKAVYEKINYIVTHPVDGTVPADSVVVSFKPAPGRKWADGSTGPKVFYIKKDMDISKLDKNGVPIKQGDTTTESILQYLSKQLYGTGTTPDWTKSSMDNTTLVPSMNNARKTDPKAWYSKDAFQEFVAHQKEVLTPSVKNEIFITQYGDVPDAKDFINNMGALELDNIAKKDGKYEIKVQYGENDKKRPSSDAAGVYTVPIFITVKHADMADPIVYKLTSVLHVMDKVLSDTYSKKVADNIKEKEQAQTDPSKPVQYTEEEKQFKDNYAKVVFSSDIDTKGTPKGTLVGTATYYVRKNTDIVLDTPTVIAKENQIDAQTGKKFRYVFTGWQLVITQNTPGQGGTQAGSTQPGVAPQPGANAHASTLMRSLRYRRSLDAFTPFTTLVQNETPGSTPGASEGGSTPTTISVTVPAEDLKPENLGKTLRKIEAKYGKAFTDATYTFVAKYDKQPYVIDASKQDTMRDGDVPVMFLPAPKHTWQNGSSRPYVYYANAQAGDISPYMQALQAQLGSFVDWDVYDNKGQLVTDAAEREKAFKNPKHAYTFIAKQSELPDIKPKDDIVIGVYDEVPNYDKLIRDIKQGNSTIPGLEAFMKSDRFAGFAAPSTELQLNPNASRPGMYVVHFGLNYKDDTGKIQTKDVAVNIRVLPRVIAAQNAPADGTPEDAFIKKNYTKVVFWSMPTLQNGRIGSQSNVFWVHKGDVVDPNALLAQDPAVREKRVQGIQNVPVPQTLANPGYTFFEWQKISDEKNNTVVYLAKFTKLPVAHFTLETTTEAEQSFSTRLVGDTQNKPTLKKGTKLPDGISVDCSKGNTCIISGTPHISNWKPGDTERTIELTFEAVDKRDPDKYGRSTYGLKKEITVRIVVKRPHVTTGGSHGGGSYGGGESIPWTELTPAVEAPAAPAPAPAPAPAETPAPARPRVRAARHARLPQTGDSQLAATAAEILGMGAGMISLVAGARTKKRKHEDKGNEYEN